MLSQEECDYASWQEFEDYFFNNFDPIDDSNLALPRLK